MNKTHLAISLFLIGLILFLAEPFVFSLATGTPVWYIWPWLPLSAISTERAMTVNIEPSVPTELGQNIRVTVLDAVNSTPIQTATIEISKDDFKFTINTQADGTADFEYPGETTYVTISKENYRQTMKVIPKIPDEWVRTRNLQEATWLITLAASWGPAAFLYYRSRSEHLMPKKTSLKRKKRQR